MEDDRRESPGVRRRSSIGSDCISPPHQRPRWKSARLSSRTSRHQGHGHLQCKGNLICGCRRSAAVSCISSQKACVRRRFCRDRPRAHAPGGQGRGRRGRRGVITAALPITVTEWEAVRRRRVERGAGGSSPDTDGFHGTACAGNRPRTRLVPHRTAALCAQRAALGSRLL